jgi:hypothetical protein
LDRRVRFGENEELTKPIIEKINKIIEKKLKRKTTIIFLMPELAE